MGFFVQWLQRFVQLGIDLLGALLAGLLRAPLVAAERAKAEIVIRRGEPHEVVEVRHVVLRFGRPRATAIFSGDDAPTTRHWVAQQADRIVAVATVVEAPAPEGSARWQLRGMAVLPELQGSGLGGRLLATVHAEVGEAMWCNARERAVPFYASHGWRVVSEPFDIPEVGPHRRMARDA